MKLYNYFRSSASFRVRIALALKGLAYEYVPVHIAKGEHKQAAWADVLAEGLVPALELDDGTRLTQSMAIMEFLDETQPAARACCPPMPRAVRACGALSQIVACEIHPLNNLRVLKYLVHELQVEEEAKNSWYRHWVRSGLETFEKQLAHGPAAASAMAMCPPWPTAAWCRRSSTASVSRSISAACTAPWRCSSTACSSRPSSRASPRRVPDAEA